MTTGTRSTSRQHAPRRPRLDHRAAMRLAAEEYHRFAEVLALLDGDDWSAATDCPAWDVRAMACHVVGMAELPAGIREGARQQRIAGRDAATLDIAFVDALTALQVRERETMTGAQLVAAMRDVGPRAARGRRWTPALLRRRPVPQPQEVNGRSEVWTIGFMIDVILTRDTWMHRVDVTRATGRSLRLTPEHDGVLVADVVEEWAQRHGQPYRLTLTGPAGGSWSLGSGGPALELDAVDFCRILSGRRAGEGLLATQVPF